MSRLEWMDRAACRFIPLTGPDPFFDPELFDHTKQTICSLCPVNWDCLQYSFRKGIWEGVLGGMDPDERHKFLMKHRDYKARPAQADHQRRMIQLNAKRKT